MSLEPMSLEPMSLEPRRKRKKRHPVRDGVLETYR